MPLKFPAHSTELASVNVLKCGSLPEHPALLRNEGYVAGLSPQKGKEEKVKRL